MGPVTQPSHHQGPEHEISLKRRLLTLPTFVSFSIAAAFIAFLFTRFDIDPSSTWAHIRGGNPWLLTSAFLAYYLTFPMRGHRWRILLRNVDTSSSLDSNHPSLANVSVMILLNWFANSVTWFRLGDGYRAYIFAAKFKTSFSRTVGTIAAERFLDIGIVFSLLILAGIGLLRDDTSGAAKAIILAAAILSVLGACTLLAMRLYGLRAARFLPRKLEQLYSKFQEGTLGSFRNLPSLITLSVIIWLLEASRLFLVVEAMGFEIALSLIIVAALAHSLLTTIPLTPGGLGFVELGLTGLLALSLSNGEAASVTLVDRSITYLSVVIVGGIAFSIRQFTEIRQSRPANPRSKT